MIRLFEISTQVGCGKTVFPSEKLIVNTIAQQMKEKALDDISGLEFGWWSVWTRHVGAAEKGKPRRVKRQNDEYEGDDDEDYDYNYDDDDER